MSGCNIADTQRRSKENNMKYMGSKSRIAKHILPIMLNEAKKHNIKVWVEPFVGGANMIDKVPETFKRIGYDLNEYIIEMFKSLQQGFIPKDLYTKEEYDYIKSNKDENKALTGYVGINCSYSGKWFGGYAGIVNTKGGVRNYQEEAKRNVLKQIVNLKDVEFHTSSYEALDFTDCLIYLDPPYKGTTEYRDSGFDHENFYDWCRQQAKKNIVFVSEYTAPDDFVCVWEQEVKSSLSANGVSGGSKVSIERLFKVSNQENNMNEQAMKGLAEYRESCKRRD